MICDKCHRDIPEWMVSSHFYSHLIYDEEDKSK